MAVRSIEKGAAALDELSKTIENIKQRVTIHKLDISDKKSIETMVAWIKTNYTKSGIDCLINNAGVLIPGDVYIVPVKDYTLTEDAIKHTLGTNFYRTVDFTELLLPFINKNGKIIFTGSIGGRTVYLTSEKLKAQFLDENIDKSKLYGLV